MGLAILISNSSGLPIYEQIGEQLKQAILDGTLSEGELVPSIRQMAADLRVSVMTTSRAYAELEAQGFIVTVPGKGSYVAGVDNQLVREQMVRRVEESIGTAVNAARLARLEKSDLNQILDLIWQGEQNE